MGICLSKGKKGRGSLAAEEEPPSPNPKHNKTATAPSLGKKQKKEQPLLVAQPQQQPCQPKKVVEQSPLAVHERKQVFLITPSKKKMQPAATTQLLEDVLNAEPPMPEKKQPEDARGEGALELEEAKLMMPVRTSSCTKEEVESILIQCGRLSRSSSGKTSNETGGGRKYSGSKRSYDFDNDKRDEEDWDKGVVSSSRPSPRRKASSRGSSRERDGGGEHKRSDSRERGSGGGRRVSRSPGKRSDGATNNSAVVDKSSKQQPAKMVSVPAREKSSSANVGSEGGGAVNRRRNNPSGAVNGVRSKSPRSRSPANVRATNENPHAQQPQSLSRSSSKKAEQSPYRRNPMAEIDENVPRVEQQSNLKTSGQNRDNNTAETQKASRTDGTKKATSQNQSQKTKSELRNGREHSPYRRTSAPEIGVREQLLSCRAKEQHQGGTEMVEDFIEAKAQQLKIGVDVAESLNSKTITSGRSSRRSSRDLDVLLNNPNTTTYTSLLLEDIQSYHQKNTGFSLPACVSKACSILEAVADLNSSSSENRAAERSGTNEDCSSNGQMLRKGFVGHQDSFVESELPVTNDLTEPSFHKYVSVRDKFGVDMEPQESAGSNSIVGQPWNSTWEPNSVDSTDRCWTSSSWSNNNEEIEGSEDFSPLENEHRYQKELLTLSEPPPRESDPRGKKQRNLTVSNSISMVTTSSGKKREIDQRQLRHGNGKVGIGRSSAALAAAAASS